MIPTFITKILAAKNGDLSSTRLCLIGVTSTLCAFVWAIIVSSLRTGTIPDVPAGTGLFLGGLIAVIASLKGVQNKQENEEETK
jgi:hydrogenase-4 membrane subunit HyfE